RSILPVRFAARWPSPGARMPGKRPSASPTEPVIPIQARGVIAFVIAGTGPAARILLLKRRNPPVGAWCPVSGRIEQGEVAWQTALREIEEETGLKDGALFT